MREYFVQLFKDLKILTGVRQYEDIASMEDSQKAQETLDQLVNALVFVCNTFSYIPDKDKQAIIKRKMMEDVKFYGLNAQKIWQYLNSSSSKYFSESHHREVNEMEVKPLEPLSAETQKLIDDYLIQLSGIGDHKMASVHAETERIKFEDKMRSEGKDISRSTTATNNYVPPNKEYLVMNNLRREWGLLFHDIQTGKPTDDYIAFEEWIKLTG